MITNKSITILIQGHGEEKIDPVNLYDVKLLSFSGTIGEPGVMDFCDNGDPLDIAMVKHIAGLYNGIIDASLQKEFYEDDNFLVEPLKRMYEDCRVTFPCGFRRTYPKKQRKFHFKPNGHENCKKCIKRGDNICIQERNPRKRLCPEYGLTVVTSSDPSDYRFTLAGKTEYEGTSISNCHMNLTTRQYWDNKIKHITYDSQNAIQDIFDSMFDENYIFLSDVVAMFKEMGYQTIYILDPTCRDCKPVSKLKKAIHSVWETVQPRSSRLWEELLPDIKKQVSRNRPITTVSPDRFEIKKEKNQWRVCDKVAQTCAVVVAGTALYYYLNSIGVLPSLGFGKTKRRRRVINKKKQSKRKA